MRPAALRPVRWLDLLMALCLAVMVVLVFGNVVLRYLFNTGITASEEVSRWLFVWLVFLGAMAGLARHRHLGTDLLVSRLGRRARRGVLAVAQLAMLGVTMLMLHGSLVQVRINLPVEAPVTGASMGLFYASGVVFACGACLILLHQLWRTLAGRLRDDELAIAQEGDDWARIAPPSPDPGAASPR